MPTPVRRPPTLAPTNRPTSKSYSTRPLAGAEPADEARSGRVPYLSYAPNPSKRKRPDGPYTAALVAAYGRCAVDRMLAAD